MSVEATIHLNKFRPRDYQLPLFDALETKGYKRILCIWPRRAGKDVCCFNLMLRQALNKVGVYYYIFPTYSQARKVVWDSITNEGVRFLDYIPPQLIEGKPNATEMKIRLTNGSLIQLIGSDDIDRVVGTNPRGIVFSEYALQDPRAYQFLRPIIVGNEGWMIFISTVRGKNHMYEMFNIASHSPDWFVDKLTVEDTGHISVHEIEKEKAEGLMSEDLIMQEYYNHWELGVEGSYYAKYMDRMRLDGRIGMVPWESGFRVNTAWDIGVRDSTSIIFYQVVGATVRIIDCYENSKEGLEHYINVVRQKPYVYGKHFAPPDIAVVEWGTGMSRIEKAEQLGIKFEYIAKDNKKVSVIPSLPIADGIEAVRSAFSKMWIDEANCRRLIIALENYRQEYDAKRKVYNTKPLHDIHSHMADAMRYLVLSLPKNRDGLTAEELDRRYHEAMYGDRLPRFFQDNDHY